MEFEKKRLMKLLGRVHITKQGLIYPQANP